MTRRKKQPAPARRSALPDLYNVALPSVSALVECCKARAITTHPANQTLADHVWSQAGHRPEWSDLPRGTTIEQVLDTVQCGSQPHTDRLAAALSGLDIPQATNTRRRPAWIADGDDYSRERQAAGYDNCCRGSVRGNGAGPRDLTVVCQISAAHTVTAGMLARRGLAAAALASALSVAGHRVRIVAAASVYALDQDNNEYGRGEVSFVVKDSDQPLDLAAVAAALVLPDTFRVALIGLVCSLAPRETNDSLAHTAPVRHAIADADGTVVYLDTLFARDSEVSGWINAQLEMIENAN